MFHFGKEYIIRHDKGCTHLHYSICSKLGTETAENWYSHIPKVVCEHENITVLWNQGVQTKRFWSIGQPDIIIKDMEDNICLLIIPSDRNVVHKENEKKLKIKI
jgi:hypothetical protein